MIRKDFGCAQLEEIDVGWAQLFPHSVSSMSCVELLLIVFYRHFLAAHIARPVAVLGSAT